MEIGFLLMKISRLYVFKMAANGRHFEKTLEPKIIKLNLFLKTQTPQQLHPLGTRRE